MGELCGRGQAMWPWVSCVAVGKLYTAGELYAAGELYVADELLYRWRAVWQWRALWQWRAVQRWASCAAVGKLCGGGVFRWGLAFHGVGVDVTRQHHTL